MVSEKIGVFGRQLFSIDLRTLALFRIALAIACIVQVLSLWPDAAAFFDDQALYPRRFAVTRNNPYAWSLYYVSGQVLWAHLLFSLTLLSSIALLVGYRTRLATVVTWALILSLTVRIVLIRNGGPLQLSVLLFWSMFLPLGARFSVDAALSRQPEGNNRYLSWATAAILIQEIYLYFFGALVKTAPAWRVTYDAVYYIFHTSDLTSPLAPYVASWVGTQKVLTYFVYYLELWAVAFLFSPYKTAWARLVVLPFLFLLHVGFALFMSIGAFPLISIVGLMVFVPGLFWDRLAPARFPWRWTVTPRYDRCLAFRLRLPEQCLVVILAAAVMVWNIGTLPGFSLGAFYRPLSATLNVTGLAQRWVFFAPNTHYETLWVVIEGEKNDGANVDLLRFRPEAPSHARPPHGYAAFTNNYWWEYFSRVRYATTQVRMGRYFCTEWNRRYPATPVQVARFTVYRQRATSPEGASFPVRTLTQFSYKCVTQ